MKGLIKILFALTVVITLVLPCYVYAQGVTEKGIKAGMNITSIDASGTPVYEFPMLDDEPMEYNTSKKSKLGAVFGAYITYSFTQMFAIQPEILFSMNGVKYESTSESVHEFFGPVTFDSEELVELSYLQIPILAKVTFGSGYYKPNLFAGPALGIMLGTAKQDGMLDLQAGLGSLYSEWDRDLDDTKSTDFGLVLGGGLSTPTGIIDIRYTLGMSKVYEGEIYDEFKNTAISIMVGYAF